MTDVRTIGARRWLILAIGVLAQAAQATIVNGVAFLIPTLHEDAGFTLAQAGTLAGAPLFGGMFTLVLWGAVADRHGERLALTAGLGITSAAVTAAAFTTSLPVLAVLLVVGGAGAVSANAASGRVVVGWFPPHRRGLAMGIRQMSVPLGVAASALAVPQLASGHGISWALAFPAVVCGVAAVACAVGIVDPPRPERSEAARTGALDNPYRTGSVLARIHAASILLVIPQYVVWTYALVWLITDRGWSETSAGLVITAAQILGALGRVAAGAWSDRVGSRLAPLRTVAMAVAVSMLALSGVSMMPNGALAVAVLLVASVATSSPNGLAFTAVAEIAGPYWGGRALGVQNTGQFVFAAAVGPVFGALIAAVGFPAAFALSAIAPAAAVPVVPTDPAVPTPERTVHSLD
ncbi:MAG: MFS transporter [Rhodococcus sp.]|uniref:MFS transporter n=1 Tax=Rhodococcus TaxID=1827 RepID=UPI0016923CDE|nr:MULTISPECIES: MFS transporter [Rhodococcus]NLV80361.1 MFS transporter [Rhodococcus sp. (in: high G+C Gram-positive bacteria)]